MTDEPTFRVKVDAKRRPTLPQSLLDAAGVGVGQDLIAHLEEGGRIVLEGQASVLARLQAAVRAGAAHRGLDTSPAGELLAERAGDAGVPAPGESKLDGGVGAGADVR